MKRSKWIRNGATLLGSALLCVNVANAADVQINGFGSAYLAKPIGNEAIASPWTNKNFDFSKYSRFGLNISSRLADDFDVAAQLEVSGSRFDGFFNREGWGMYANWAFANYHPGDLVVKVGRQLYPSWLAAEYLDVGYLQPYRTLPVGALTVVPFRGFDGLTLGYKFDLDFARLYIAAFGGQAYLNSFGIAGEAATQSAIDVSNMAGGTFTLTGNGYRFHGMLARSKVTATTLISTISNVSGVPLPVVSTLAAMNNATANELAGNLGFTYDKYNIVIWAEYAFVKSNDGTQLLGSKFLESGNVFYALGGYRIGRFMPRYMYSRSDVSQLGFGLGKVTTQNIGLNFQLNEKAIIKVDLQLDKSDEVPTFMTGTVGSTATTASAGVDFIF